MKYDFQFAVIGGGSAGLTAAGFASSIDVSTVLIEAEHLGGDCTWSGCVPSKAMIHAAATDKLSKEYEGDYTKLQAFIQQKIDEVYRFETPEEFSKNGTNVMIGKAEFVDKHTLKVTKADGSFETVTAKKICVASGAVPLMPKSLQDSIDKNLKGKVWTYLDVWGAKVLPKSMVVIGGGPIGTELAQAFLRLGVEITVVASSLLPKEIDGAREILSAVLKSEGLKHVKGRAQTLSFNEETGLVDVHVKDSGEIVSAQIVLVSAGRKPNIPPGLDKLVSLGKSGGILVDKFLRCKKKGGSVSTIFAAGDCIEGNPQFTHYAGKQGYWCARNSQLYGTVPGLVPLEVPRVTFTSPEIASVGFSTVEMAVENGFKKAMKISSHGEHIDRAVTDDEQDRTLFEVIVSNGKTTAAKMLGVNVIAQNAGEILSVSSYAVKNRLTLLEFTDVIYPYPTYAFGFSQMIASEVSRRFSDNSKKLISVGKALNH